MQTEIMVNLEKEGVQREEIEDRLQDIETSYPEVDLEIKDPDGAFPTTPTDPFTLVIAANASVQLLACIYPKLKSKISEIRGESEVLNVEDVAAEYLEQHTRVTTDKLDLNKKEASDNYLIFVFEYLEDGSEHYIKIDPDNIRDWTYEER
jgi:hypothetical protein